MGLIDLLDQVGSSTSWPARAPGNDISYWEKPAITYLSQKKLHWLSPEMSFLLL